MKAACQNWPANSARQTIHRDLTCPRLEPIVELEFGHVPSRVIRLLRRSPSELTRLNRLWRRSPVAQRAARAVSYGDGFIDYAKFFGGLEDGGLDGLANYQMCSPIRGAGSVSRLDEYAAAYL